MGLIKQSVRSFPSCQKNKNHSSVPKIIKRPDSLKRPVFLNFNDLLRQLSIFLKKDQLSFQKDCQQ